MKGITEIKSKRIAAGPGSVALVAEATVFDWDNGDEVYVTIQDYDGTEYTVSEESVYAFLAEDDEKPAKVFLEEYTKLSEAKKSGYADVFGKLKKVMDMLG